MLQRPIDVGCAEPPLPAPSFFLRVGFLALLLALAACQQDGGGDGC
jgi:hypothetical protein